jgi:HlyD family secretion protein
LPWTGALLLIALITAGLWPQPIPVEIAAVSVGKLRLTVNEEGKTRVKQRYTIAAPVAGLLKRISFKAGAPIQAQHPVAMIEPLPPTLLDVRARTATEARRDAAVASLAKARANLDFAEKEQRRFKTLFEQKAISVQELESVQLRYDAALKDEQAAQSTLKQVEAELTQFTTGSNKPDATAAPVVVKAPVSGVVLRVFEESSRVIASGTPLLELGDPADLEVVIEVLSRDGATITPGTKVELEQWGGDSFLEARVRLVEPAAFTKVSALGVEEQRVNVIADLITPSAQRPGLGDGFRVESRIVLWETDKALKVPAGALFRRGAEWAAFVFEDGRARLRTVQVGASSGSEMQILGGLKEGDRLVLYPGNRVRDAQRVRQIQL